MHVCSLYVMILPVVDLLITGVVVGLIADNGYGIGCSANKCEVHYIECVGY